MLRLTILCVLATCAFAVQELAHTHSKDCIRKQKFVYDMLWKFDTLPKNFPQIYHKAKDFKPRDLLKIPVNQKSAKELVKIIESGKNLATRDPASPYDDRDLAEIKILFDVLHSAADFDTFAMLALWTKLHLGYDTWFYVYSTVVLHRGDTRRTRLPNLHEIRPYYAFNTDVIKKFEEIKNGTDYSKYDKDQEKIILDDQPAYGPDGEDDDDDDDEDDDDSRGRLSYFTKDVGLNDFHASLQLDLPFWLASDKYDLPSFRRGENYFNDYKQLLARYNLERLANGLDKPPGIKWDRLIPAKYREKNDTASDKNSTSSIAHGLVKRIKDLRKNLVDAAETGVLKLKSGELTDHDGGVDANAFFNTLMNTVQGNGDSANPELYGSLETTLKQLFKRISGWKPSLNRSHIFNPMESIDVRDAVFYKVYQEIVDIGRKYKSHLVPYTPAELRFPGLKIDRLDVDKIFTYNDQFDSLIDYQQLPNSTRRVPIVVRQDRLNHRSFNVSIKVQSDADVRGIVRLFIGPKYDADGNLLDIDDIEYSFFQLDQFIVNFKKGLNVIIREDDDFVYQVPDAARSDKFYDSITKAYNENGDYKYYKHPIGYPRRLMVPKGRVNGFTLRFFVIINSLDEDTEVDTLVAGRELNDGRALGFPFDRSIDASRFNQTNMLFKDITIYHNIFKNFCAESSQ